MRGLDAAEREVLEHARQGNHWRPRRGKVRGRMAARGLLLDVPCGCERRQCVRIELTEAGKLAVLLDAVVRGSGS